MRIDLNNQPCLSCRDRQCVTCFGAQLGPYDRPKAGKASGCLCRPAISFAPACCATTLMLTRCCYYRHSFASSAEKPWHPLTFRNMARVYEKEQVGAFRSSLVCAGRCSMHPCPAGARLPLTQHKCGWQAVGDWLPVCLVVWCVRCRSTTRQKSAKRSLEPSLRRSRRTSKPSHCSGWCRCPDCCVRAQLVCFCKGVAQDALAAQLLLSCCSVVHLRPACVCSSAPGQLLRLHSDARAHRLLGLSRLPRAVAADTSSASFCTAPTHCPCSPEEQEKYRQRQSVSFLYM